MQSSTDVTRDILGVSVLVSTARELTARIDRATETGTPVRLAFLNTNLANLSAKDRDLARTLGGFWIVNDGIGLDIAGRLLYGAPFPENLNGTDYTPYFLDATARDLRIFLLGARGDVVARAAAELERRWPRHKVVGYRDGYFSNHDEEALTAEIAATAPNIVLVGMGNPRQEQWISKHIPGASSQAFAVGAWFDFLAGEFPRAPILIRKIGLEWFFRLANEPRRLFSRYAIGVPTFLARVLHQRWRTPPPAATTRGARNAP